MGFEIRDESLLSGSTTIEGTLSVHDNVDFLGELEVSGRLYCDGDVQFTGSTIIGGTLNVAAYADF
jgi:hypothetical protein